MTPDLSIDNRVLHDSLAASLLGKTIPEPNTGCLLWTGKCDARGYGELFRRHGGKRCRIFAHRAALYLHMGPIPSNAVVRHTCDTPSCVNPDHLELGTQRDNILDTVRRGRHSKLLAPDDVRNIRGLFAIGLRQIHIARMFCVSKQAIHDIVHRISWQVIR